MTASIFWLYAAAVVLAHGSSVHLAGQEGGRPGNAERIDGLTNEHLESHDHKVSAQTFLVSEPSIMDKRHTAMGNMLSVRWCVTDPCELEKCKRMATEFNYMVSPRLHWSCVMEKSKDGCMQEIKNGGVDVMMAEGDEIYKASKIYGLMPIMAEKFKGPYQNHYSIALVKNSTDEIKSFNDMANKKSCHSGMDTMASFKTPMCSLIHKKIVPKAGNVFESAAEFFKESCVPGVLHVNFNPNMTTPDSLCKLCKGPKDKFDFCMTLSDKEPYYGFTGALKCLRENQGDVGFFHTLDVTENLHTLSQEFQLVCRKKRKPLNWKNIINPNCHLAEEHPQVLMVSERKSKDWINNCTNALEDASSKLSSSGVDNRFSLFDSSPYCAKKVTEADTSEDTKWNIRNWMKNSHLIFKDYSNGLETIDEGKRSHLRFLGEDTSHIWKSCAQLEPKPRAFVCVVGNEEMQKCKATIDSFQGMKEVRRNFSWGCVKVNSKKDCMDLIDCNTADIVDLNATDMFLAGNDYNLAPFIGRNYKGKDPWTKSITVGVMRKELRRDLTRDTSGWKLCSGSIHNTNGFLHPIGWLLANGTIKRSSTLLKSITDHFNKSCVPGMKSLDLLKHPLLSRTLDWDSLLEKISWEGWYETPLWMKWQKKQTGLVNDYLSMHDIYNFESPQFQRIMEIVMSAEPEMITDAQLVQKIQGLKEKMRQEFSWDKYDGLEDFYGSKQKFSWDMTSWLWEKPVDLTKLEWQVFMSWAEKVWDQKEDWENYMKKWPENAWNVFKNWIDEGYRDYLSNHKPLQKDVFIRFSLLSDRYHWLMQQWRKLQWNSKDIKSFREKLCDACVGQGKNKCALNDTEPYYGNLGSLRCLKEEQADVAFMDWYAFEDALRRTDLKKEDFLLLCPDGTHVQANKTGAVKECNFGKVPSNALATCNMHDKVWRWKFTKTLHHVKKEWSPRKFEDSIFGAKAEDLSAIPFANQTYPVWLGSKFLDAMEGIMQPTGEEHARHKELRPTTLTKFLIEKHHLDDPFDLPSCDECEIKDIHCKINCWAAGPSVSDKTESTTGRKRVIKKMGKFGEHRMIPQVLPRRPLIGIMMKKSKNPEIKLWKPEGLKIHSVVHDFRHSMAHGGHHEMRSPIMSVEHAGKHQMEMPGMMDHDKFTSTMKNHIRPVTLTMHKMSSGSTKNWMETGPIMRSHETLRSEFYSKVIFAKNGTCNTIVRELRCFGEKKNIQMWAGRVSKTLISVPMCPLPTDMKKTTAQFTCNTGANFIRPIYFPVGCSYAPCRFWNADWTNNEDWGQSHHPNRLPSKPHDTNHE